MAIRRMYEAFPKLGIRFAVPIYPLAMPMTGTPGEAASIAGAAPPTMTSAVASAAPSTTSAAANAGPAVASPAPVEAVKAAE
jgi:hypothetical protein